MKKNNRGPVAGEITDIGCMETVVSIIDTDSNIILYHNIVNCRKNLEKKIFYCIIKNQTKFSD